MVLIYLAHCIYKRVGLSVCPQEGRGSLKVPGGHRGQLVNYKLPLTVGNKYLRVAKWNLPCFSSNIRVGLDSPSFHHRHGTGSNRLLNHRCCTSSSNAKHRIKHRKGKHTFVDLSTSTKHIRQFPAIDSRS